METLMEKHQNSYRFERKFIINPEHQFDFLLELTKCGFSEIYKQRRINNIYLDDYNYTNVLENVEGISKRQKTRIRWYGDLNSISNKNIEFKIKSDDVNRKENIPLQKCLLESLEHTTLFWESIRDYLMLSCNHKFLSNQLFKLQPTLVNSYTRNYFINADESIRITIDKDLFYYSPITFTEATDPLLVVEIKYNSKYILSDNLLRDLALTKYSKYVKGVLSTSTFKAIY